MLTSDQQMRGNIASDQYCSLWSGLLLPESYGSPDPHCKKHHQEDTPNQCSINCSNTHSVTYAMSLWHELFRLPYLSEWDRMGKMQAIDNMMPWGLRLPCITGTIFSTTLQQTNGRVVVLQTRIVQPYFTVQGFSRKACLGDYSDGSR